MEEKINGLKNEVKKLQEEERWGLELRMVKNNLDILQQKEQEFWRMQSWLNWLA